MRTGTITLIDDHLQREVDKANDVIENADDRSFEDFVTSPIFRAFISLIEADRLSHILAWQAGTLYKKTIDPENPDPEAEQRARHTIETLDHVIAYMNDFESMKEELDRLKGSDNDESNRTQSTLPEA